MAEQGGFDGCYEHGRSDVCFGRLVFRPVGT